MHIELSDIKALKALYAEFNLLYEYAKNRPCEDSNKIIADIVRANSISECSIENMNSLREIINKFELMGGNIDEGLTSH